ncbi:MAG: cytochrome c-type biogenesis protein CcmH [Zoogloeaceae bacterium]|jgi:cytochrome c-type biogenesis protein CcmH|nr:cytochrome c-type biogenesis protein CcmH [Zoogloeaceae bacterium]
MNALRFFTLCLALFAASPLQWASAEEARPLADDPAAEARLLEISSELRCLVCQNETIAASNADLANDLRAQIRGMIQSGKSDDEIVDFMVTRYGDFVLYRPPVKTSTLFLWGGPLLFLVAGIFGLRRYILHRNRLLATGNPLSDADRHRAKTLLAAGDAAPPDHPETPRS